VNEDALHVAAAEGEIDGGAVPLVEDVEVPRVEVAPRRKPVLDPTAAAKLTT
jgi:hypothetical protein